MSKELHVLMVLTASCVTVLLATRGDIVKKVSNSHSGVFTLWGRVSRVTGMAVVLTNSSKLNLKLQ